MEKIVFDEEFEAILQNADREKAAKYRNHIIDELNNRISKSDVEKIKTGLENFAKMGKKGRLENGLCMIIFFVLVISCTVAAVLNFMAGEKVLGCGMAVLAVMNYIQAARHARYFLVWDRQQRMMNTSAVMVAKDRSGDLHVVVTPAQNIRLKELTPENAADVVHFDDEETLKAKKQKLDEFLGF